MATHRLSSLDDLDALFRLGSTAGEHGGWRGVTKADPTWARAETGPGTSTPFPCVVSDVAGGDDVVTRSRVLRNSTLLVRESVMQAWTATGRLRTLGLRLCLAGAGWSDPRSGVLVEWRGEGQGQEHWMRLALIRGWPWTSSQAERSAVTDHAGVAHEYVRAGRWLDRGVNIPDDATGIRIRVVPGSADTVAGLWRVEFIDGSGQLQASGGDSIGDAEVVYPDAVTSRRVTWSSPSGWQRAKVTLRGGGGGGGGGGGQVWREIVRGGVARLEQDPNAPRSAPAGGETTLSYVDGHGQAVTLRARGGGGGYISGWGPSGYGSRLDESYPGDPGGRSSYDSFFDGGAGGVGWPNGGIGTASVQPTTERGEAGGAGGVGGTGDSGREFIYAAYTAATLPAVLRPDDDWGFDSPGTVTGSVGGGSTGGTPAAADEEEFDLPAQAFYPGTTVAFEPASRPEIRDDAFLPSSGRRWFGQVRLYPSGQVDIKFSSTLGGSLDARADLSDAWEERGEFVIEADGRTLTVPMAGSDATEPYEFTPSNSAEVIAFYNAFRDRLLQSIESTVTLRLPGTGTGSGSGSGTPTSVSLTWTDAAPTLDATNAHLFEASRPVRPASGGGFESDGDWSTPRRVAGFGGTAYAGAGATGTDGGGYGGGGGDGSQGQDGLTFEFDPSDPDAPRIGGRGYGGGGGGGAGELVVMQIDRIPPNATLTLTIGGGGAGQVSRGPRHGMTRTSPLDGEAGESGYILIEPQGPESVAASLPLPSMLLSADVAIADDTTPEVRDADSGVTANLEITATFALDPNRNAGGGTIIPRTQYWSVSGLRGANRYWQGRILDLSPIGQELSLIPDDYRISEISLTLDDSDGEIRALKSETAFLNRGLQIALGRVDRGDSDFAAIYDGEVSSWSADGSTFTLDATGSFHRQFEETVTPDRVVTTTAFPHAPAESISRLAPLVIGTINTHSYSGSGAVECILIDTRSNKYLAAQDDADDLVRILNVFVDDERVASGWTQASETHGGRRYRVVTFAADQDGARVTADIQGMTDENEVLTPNPVRVLRRFLIENGFGEDDFDTASFDAAETRAGSIGLEIALWVTDSEKRVREVMDDFVRSTNISIYASRDGKIAVDVPEPEREVQARARIGAEDIEADTFEIEHSQDVASVIDYRYRYSAAANSYEADGSHVNPGQEDALAREVRVQMDMPFQFSATSAARVIADRAYFMREERVRVTFRADPSLYRDLSIGDDVELTHFAGLGDGGYDAATFRIIGISLLVEHRAMLAEFTLVDVG